MYGVIDIDYINNNSLIQNLIDEPDNVKNNYINRAEAIIFSYINLNQFKQEDWIYNFPEDLKLATLFVVEYLYLNWWTFKQSWIKSEKIGDYSYTLSDQQINKLSEIDMPINIVSILNKYRKKASFYDITIWGYDRQYANQ